MKDERAYKLYELLTHCLWNFVDDAKLFNEIHEALYPDAVMYGGATPAQTLLPKSGTVQNPTYEVEGTIVLEKSEYKIKKRRRKKQ